LRGSSEPHPDQDRYNPDEACHRHRDETPLYEIHARDNAGNEVAVPCRAAFDV
jgi:hypothetical protein